MSHTSVFKTDLFQNDRAAVMRLLWPSYCDINTVQWVKRDFIHELSSMPVVMELGISFALVVCLFITADVTNITTEWKFLVITPLGIQ